MDLTIANTIVGALLLAVGWILKQFWEMWREARGRRRSEVQKLTDERNKARSEAKQNYIKKMRWRDATYATRQVAMTKGNVAPEELPPTPDD